MRLLNALRREGPATASRLAAKLGESSGATSYHLRQLAAHGFVEDAPGRGTARERWWKAVHQGVRFDEALLKDRDPEVRGAADLFLHEAAGQHARELAAWLGTRDEWRGVAPVVGPERLDAEPHARARPRTRRQDASTPESYQELAPAADTPGVEQVRIHTHVMPVSTDGTDGTD
ncbi:winged helix-turn-helix domain-containing protein [Streptomyces sp. KL116D]|uniref:winged helix-turn-helix domain-containing protein n=1 Tax=Streptomyces sp. KL116D TaxID=3045152 RepID=UPI0035570F12